MSETAGAGLIVLGIVLIPVAAAFILFGSRSLVRVMGMPGMEVFSAYVRLLIAGSDDPATRVAARQTRAGWVLWFIAMLSILVGAVLIGSA